MEPTNRLAAITDEFSGDLAEALDAMASVGISGVELRTVDGRNVVDLDESTIDSVCAAVRARSMRVVAIASPIFKCVLPGGPALDSRFEKDVFGSQHTFEDQPRLIDRALHVAKRTGAPIIRAFSFWRTVEPASVYAALVPSLRDLAERAQAHGLIVGIENEHACNVGTAAESAQLLAQLDHPALGLIWDPANALVAGEVPYPDGYQQLPSSRIVHVHAKDCHVDGYTPTWGALGEMSVDWPGQIAALLGDGYAGWFSLETHWTGPRGDKKEASLINGRNLGALLAGRAPART